MAFAQDVRIVLASAEFSRELTTAIMWLNERQLDIRCVRLKPYRLGERLLLDVQQVIPLPEVAEYQVRIRDKERRGREERSDRSNTLREFWTALLARARGRTSLHASIGPSDVHWVGVASGVRGVSYNYVAMQSEMRAELYVDRGDWGAAYNRAVFDALYDRRAAIEAVFGGPLRWDQLDGRRACRVAAETAEGGYRDPETRWPAVHDAAIDAMVRLEGSLKPHMHDVAKLRPG